jgi:exodeoxyribonuclease-3
MRVLTWNVAGRVKRQPEQAAVVAAAQADVVCLQEVTARNGPLWRAALMEAGFTHTRDALPREPVARARPLAVLTASRVPLEPTGPIADVPWPERVLECTVEGVRVLNVHSPIAPAPDLAKVRTHEAIAEHLAAHPATRSILCGDLNTPRREHDDGEIMTFAYTSAGDLRPERGERWDHAERALVRNLRNAGWLDAFRTVNGYGSRDASWTFKDDRGGWRLDHVLVHGFDVRAAAYAHEWRRTGLSDHSALIVDLRASSS